MREEYDVIIVGGGPGGTTAAFHAALGGAKVLLLEKKRDIGFPVRCAEGIGEAGLSEFLNPDPKWAVNKINACRFIAPDGSKVMIKNRELGYILNRRVFDYLLAEMASEKGAEIMTGVFVNGVIIDDGTVKGVTAEYLGEKFSIRSKIVIGADGVESRVGRWCGIKSNISLRDIETCAQVTISGKKIRLGVSDFYFGKNIAPGGYAWVFPKGENIANVGLGISGIYSKKRSPLFYLNEFLKNHFPDISILTRFAGGVPCAKTMKKIVSDGLMLVGDAAHQANPITGGGIVNAMKAGRIAGNVAADAVLAGDVSKKVLKRYPEQWNSTVGEINERCYRMKKVIFNFSDKSLNILAKSFNENSNEKLTIKGIFIRALKKHPSLVTDAIKVFK
ncbi:NAD(P)/FAD-dependent oxidoreductase [candidate division KSB1 bacterium]